MYLVLPRADAYLILITRPLEHKVREKREAINRWAFNKMQITGRGDRLSRIAVNKAIFATSRIETTEFHLLVLREEQGKKTKRKKKNTKIRRIGRKKRREREKEKEKKEKKVDRGNSV